MRERLETAKKVRFVQAEISMRQDVKERCRQRQPVEGEEEIEDCKCFGHMEPV